MSIPLSRRNELLEAAGLAAVFPQRTLDDASLQPVMRIIKRMLDTHEPYPAILLGPGLQVLDTNDAASRLFPGMSEMTSEAMVDLLFGPGPYRELVENWVEVFWVGLETLRREADRGDSPEVSALLRQAEAYAEDVERPEDGTPELPVICPRFRIGGRTIRTISSVMRFDNAVDVTVAGLRLELMFPADADATAFFQEGQRSSKSRGGV